MSNYSGIVKNLSNTSYHKDRTHVSSTVIKTAITDPVKYKKVYLEGKELDSGDLDKFIIGNYTHSLILEPATIDEEYAFFEGATRIGKNWEAFQYANSQKTIVTRSMKEMGDSLFEAYCMQDFNIDGNIYKGPQLLVGAEKELSVFTSLKGVDVKVRYDAINVDKGVIFDVKTTEFPANTIDEARSTIIFQNYGLSAALYKDVAEKQWNKPFTFYWVFLCKRDKRCNIYSMSHNTYEIGKHKYEQGLELIKYWKETGNIPVATVREV